MFLPVLFNQKKYIVKGKVLERKVYLSAIFAPNMLNHVCLHAKN